MEKKKVVLIGFAKLKYMPYMNFYLNQIDQNYEIHIIYWNRDDNEDIQLDRNIILHKFNVNMEDTELLVKKIPNFYKFSKFAKKELLLINPDKIIVMCTPTAITLYRSLIKSYRNKYIFDFRDVTYERFSFYRYLVGNLVKNSNCTFVSSEGFIKYLPNDNNKIFISHNIDKTRIEKRYDVYKSKKNMNNEVIKIAYWGLIRHSDVNHRIIELIGNSPKFELHYYGRATGNDLMVIIEGVKKYSNIFFHGEYMPSDVSNFANDTDLIHNIFSSEDATMPYAMANKFYDGLLFYIPQITSKGSLMGRKCSENGVGYECSIYDDDLLDKIEKYYRNLNYNQFKCNCDRLFNSIEHDIELGEMKIKEFLYC